MKVSKKLDTIEQCKQIFIKQGGKEKELYHYFEKANIVLKTYRFIAWSMAKEIDDFYFEAQELASEQLYEALEYLAEFAPKNDRIRFRERTTSLVWSAFLISTIDKALAKIAEYPYNGKSYCEILSKGYFTKFEYTDIDIAEILEISRPTYYRRKKEAKALFATTLFCVLMDLENNTQTAMYQ